MESGPSQVDVEFGCPWMFLAENQAALIEVLFATDELSFAVASHPQVVQTEAL